MKIIPLISVLLLLSLPEEVVEGQAFKPPSPFPTDPYCDYYCIQSGISKGANDSEPGYPLGCIDLREDDMNPGTGCSSTERPSWWCPPECTQCDKQGQLWCPPLTDQRRNQAPPPTKVQPFETSCLHHCQNPHHFHGGITVDSGPYTIDCGGTWFEWSIGCGLLYCPGCEGPLYQNPKCKPFPHGNRDPTHELECQALDRSLFPAACSQFCGEEAWLQGMRGKTDKPFTVNCGDYPYKGEKGQRCGSDCPNECDGFCPEDGNVYCPAGVEPNERTTTTTETSAVGKNREEEESLALIIGLSVMGVLVVLLVAVGLFFWGYRKEHGGRRAVGPGQQLAYPTQQLYQPPPIMTTSQH